MHPYIPAHSRHLYSGPLLCPRVPWLSSLCMDVWGVSGGLQLRPKNVYI